MSRLVVAGILINEEGSVLLCQRTATGRRDGAWSLPGTDVTAADTDVTSIRHELLSSLGIRVDPSSAETFDAQQDTRTLRAFVFRSWRGRIVNLDKARCANIRWFALGDIPEVTPSAGLLIQTYRSPVE